MTRYSEMKMTLVGVVLFCLLCSKLSVSANSSDQGSQTATTVVVNHGVIETNNPTPEESIDAGTYGEHGLHANGDDRKGENVKNETRTRTRHRRLIRPTSVWPKSIIPYIFEDDLAQSDRFEILVAQRRIEQITCLKYVPWEGTKTQNQYNLTDDDYVRFVEASGCWATRTKVSCCSRHYCTHELGHSLGLPHEHTSPYRHGYIRANYHNIDESKWGIYTPYTKDKVVDLRYDMSSHMHYNPTGFSNNSWHTMTVLFRDLQPILSNRGNVYYTWMTLANAYSCTAERCPNGAPVKCVNDGFVSFINGKCACMCPPGLDPEFGCSTIIRQVSAPTKWPVGSYALLGTIDGCPDDVFKTGTVHHVSDGRTDLSSPLHAGGSYTDDDSKYNFCVKDTDAEADEDTAVWSSGRYCIYKKGPCPQDFEEGYIRYDNLEGTNTTVTGTVPDGVYDSDTRFNFCCRDDGFQIVPLKLPNTKPFILYMNDGDGCQEVDGMLNHQEIIDFDNDGSNKGYSPDYLSNKLKLCYYVPANKDCGGMFSLTKANPSMTITSSNYPNNYNNNLDCYWIFTAPEDSNILLKFEDFDIAPGNDGGCEDMLKIRSILLGENAFEYCGDGLHRTIRSVRNTLSINFRTSPEGQRKGFKAHVSLVSPENHCFKMADKGLSYRGNVSFTRDQQSCLPWAKTVGCAHHLFNGKDFDKNLEENYCRNPDRTFRPWCYTAVHDGQCDRDYCDACQLETKYDMYPDCDKLKQQGFCERPVAEVRAGCARTCDTPRIPAGSTITTCSKPDTPPDASPTTTLKTSYEIGDTVDFKCKTGDNIMTRMCQSDGQWSQEGVVCGRCSTGWVRYNGHCYWHVAEHLNYEAAKQVCSAKGGIVSPGKDLRELSFLASFGGVDESFWLGASDSVTEGTFVWSDGTPVTWTNWDVDDRQPNNYANQDCIESYSVRDNYLWNDEFCDNKHSFLCRSTLSNQVFCVDNREDCASILKSTPRACVDHEMFAVDQCPFSCGVCVNSTMPAKNCAFSSSNWILVAPAVSITQGQVFTYKCPEGRIRTSGDYDRVCLPDGTLSGKELICQDIDEIPEPVPNNNVDLVARNRKRSGDWAYMGDGEMMRIPRDGEIVQWKFFFSEQDRVLFQVWRPRKDLSELKYEFVGHNFLDNKITGRVVTLDIPVEERLQVKKGDVIGIYYFSSASKRYSICTEGNTRMSWIKTKASEPSFFVSGQIYEQSSDTGCHVYSITAMVAPVPTQSDTLVRTNWLPLISRSSVGAGRYVYTGINKNFRVPVDGEVAMWKFYSKYIGDVALQVWRPKPENGTDKYALVGQNVLKTIDNGIQVVQVPVGERIQVKVGDYTAVYYGYNKGGVCYNHCDEDDNPEASNVTWMKPKVSPVSDLTIGQLLTLSTRSCRVFSLTAFIKPSA